MARTTKTASKHRPSGRGGKSRYIPKRKVCPFCVNKVREIDYKDIALLRRFISERGRMEPRRKTGVCARHQRVLSIALKRARHIALLPYTAEHIRIGSGLGFRESSSRGSGHRAARIKEPVHEETSPEIPVVEEGMEEETKAEETTPEEAIPEEPASNEKTD
ncbi:MAG: 30S ribosomal protein S18 [Dehalococcoidia bacterium]|nr:MAG: 30S ribosomal protein S18 [Dehalococcoidia bacterium]UCG84552.1 MAG: 30S ribosomal protein S18 [Dehalococcoidia bacterium]